MATLLYKWNDLAMFFFLYISHFPQSYVLNFVVCVPRIKTATQCIRQAMLKCITLAVYYNTQVLPDTPSHVQYWNDTSV